MIVGPRLRQAVCRTGERLSAVELAHDAEAYLQRIQEFAVLKNYVPYFDPSFIGLTGTATIRSAKRRSPMEQLTKRCTIREKIRMSTL